MKFLLAPIAAVSVMLCSTLAAADTDWTQVEQALGGAPQPGGVYKFGFPRSDLKVTVDAVSIKPSLALGSWLAFKALRSNGIEVTALHSHMIDDSPHLYFMHFWANDDAGKLAKGVRAALDLMNVKRGS